jgi:hypothetical protein
MQARISDKPPRKTLPKNKIARKLASKLKVLFILLSSQSLLFKSDSSVISMSKLVFFYALFFAIMRYLKPRRKKLFLLARLYQIRVFDDCPLRLTLIISMGLKCFFK